jgi:hypothetical protein
VAEENAKVKEGIATLYVVITSANFGMVQAYPREADDSQFIWVMRASIF